MSFRRLLGLALLSLALLWGFRNTATEALPHWAIGLYLLPVALILLFGAVASLARLDPQAAIEVARQETEQLAGLARAVAAQRAAYGGDDYLAAVAQRWDDMPQLVSDDVLHTYATVGTWDVIADRLRERFDGVVTSLEFSIAVRSPGDASVMGDLIARLRDGAAPAASRGG
ncbi:MAG: hypothetical protein KY442_13550 [Proteobacteria bacterium]|nr:hypothetical protein [Pseudomonadota bacterium]